MRSRLCCAGCGEYIYFSDEVRLDLFYTTFHTECYTGQFPLKDEGTYYDIIYKYEFMYEFRPLFPFKRRGELPTNQFIYIDRLARTENN